MALLSDNFGEVHYGLTQSGYDSWSYVEAHGGVVTLPFILIDSSPFVGVVEEFRHNLGGWTLNCPRGFIDEGETPEQAAVRELREETGFDASDCIALPGARANPNSAFFETPEENQGVVFFAFPIPLDETVEEDGERWLKRAGTGGAGAGERTGRLRFLDWREAVRLRDMFTIAAVGRLLAHLKET